MRTGGLTSQIFEQGLGDLASGWYLQVLLWTGLGDLFGQGLGDLPVKSLNKEWGTCNPMFDQGLGDLASSWYLQVAVWMRTGGLGQSEILLSAVLNKDWGLVWSRTGGPNSSIFKSPGPHTTIIRTPIGPRCSLQTQKAHTKEIAVRNSQSSTWGTYTHTLISLFVAETGKHWIKYM
jgi:hypothetical protein